MVANRKPVLIADILQDSRWVQIFGVHTEHRSAITVPLMIGDDLLVYLDELTLPDKSHIILFEQSRRFPMVEETSKFNRSLLDFVFEFI